VSGKLLRIAGINFEHFHMGDLLRMVARHPQAELVAICDVQPERMVMVREALRIEYNRVFHHWEECLDATEPDLVITCPAAASHGLWSERLLGRGVHVLMEKPMAASLAEADRMIQAAEQSKRLLAINWPMVWYPQYQLTERLIREGMIGDVLEVHYYGGNRGPLWHTEGKIERTAQDVDRLKPHSWFYQRQSGGGSLLDYMGYGATLGTWFNGGQIPLDVTAVVDEPPGLEVDEHCIAIVRYANGLSKLETRWGTFTDPWTTQPQPQCGFVVVGSEGTIGAYDYAQTLRVQTRTRPEQHEIGLPELIAPWRDPIEYFVHCIQTGEPLRGPLSPAMSRIGQQIVDTVAASAAAKSTMPLLK